ncbi:Sec62/63 complex, subunit Sec66 [Halenospora varia]|nr:Sec62/63 complex, subunit Sec66 [Halenospora varia]
MFTVHWASLVLAVLYFVVINGSAYSVHSLYQKHKAARLSALAPWFPPHIQRDIYHSLLNIEPPAGSEPASAVPKSLLKAALLQRAIEDIHRVVDVRSKKQACSTLLEKKSIGDSLWHQLLGAEKEMEVELRNVVEEANKLAPSWGQTIFQTANEMVANAKLRADLAEVQGKLEGEKEWYAARKLAAQEGGHPGSSGLKSEPGKKAATRKGKNREQ